MAGAAQLPAAALMGWLWLIALAGLAMAGLALLRVPRRLWSFCGAALMLGMAGYAWQGRPTLAASPAATVRVDDDGDAALVTLREAMFGRFTRDGAWLIAADALARTGSDRAAIQAALGGIRATPDSALLWTGLGNLLAAHDRTLSPPARFAYARAMRLAPRHPGPPFFMGIAAVRANDIAEARRLWQRALALTPPGVSYRGEIAARLALLEQLIALDARR